MKKSEKRRKINFFLFFVEHIVFLIHCFLINFFLIIPKLTGTTPKIFILFFNDFKSIQSKYN